MRNIRMGIPEMERFWTELSYKADNGQLKGADKKLFKKLVKVFSIFRANPKHPSLESHDIDELTRRYGFKVWQSYLENRRPAAGRLFWTYGPGRMESAILGVEPHPNDKRGVYSRIKLANLPPLG